MKTFSDDALDALERGDAIVSASLEIIPAPVAQGDDVVLSWEQSTFEQSVNDQAHMGLAFLDDTGSLIGAAVFADLIDTPSGAWTARSVSATVPAGFAKIRLYMEMSRRSGTNNDGYIDAIALTVDGRDVPIVNPSAEDGTAGWATETGGLDTNNSNIAPFDGSFYFTGGISALTRAFQDILPPAIRLWGGYGAKDLPSDAGTSTFLGIGDRGLANSTSAQIGGSAQNLTLTLSGVDPAALEVLDADEVRGASAVVRRLIFDSAGKTLLGSYVYTRGRVDQVTSSEVIGGPASVQVQIEGAARGLGRRGGRIRSDADQRLVKANDGFFRVASAAPQKTLYWGGKKPSVAGSSLGGGTSGSASATTTGGFSPDTFGGNPSGNFL